MEDPGEDYGGSALHARSSPSPWDVYNPANTEALYQVAQHTDPCRVWSEYSRRSESMDDIRGEDSQVAKYRGRDQTR